MGHLRVIQIVWSIVERVVEAPGDAIVSGELNGSCLAIRITVAKSDRSLFIMRQGELIVAIRHVAKICAFKNGLSVAVELAEPRYELRSTNESGQATGGMIPPR